VIQVTSLEVRSFDLDHLDIFWEIAPLRSALTEDKPHEIFDYEFSLHRSEAAMGPYEQIGGPFRDVYRFRDNRVSLLHNWRQYFYAIETLHRPTGKTTRFGPTGSKEPRPDLVALEIQRQEDLLFREAVGRRCWLYPVRTFGPVCTCYDPRTKQKTRTNHRPCFGTGWLGGYHAPVEVWVQMDPTPKGSRATTGRMGAFPPVSEGDVLIEAENRRWRLGPPTTTQRLRANIHQELRLTEIPLGDIEYELPLDIELRGLQPAAERNFTNPHTLERNEDYEDIFAAYGFPRGSLR
jgi:hypothetical protein